LTRWRAGEFQAQAYVALKQRHRRHGRLSQPCRDQARRAPLAQDFGISRTPVREAMAQLEREGFVRSVPRRGIYVVRKTKREVIELITAWAALEGMAARLITKMPSDAEIAALRRMFATFENGEVRAHLDEYSDVNIEFHQAIIRMSRNSVLIDLAENLFTHMRMIRARRSARRIAPTARSATTCTLSKRSRRATRCAPKRWCAITRSVLPSMSRNTRIIWTRTSDWERPMADAAVKEKRETTSIDANAAKAEQELTDGFHLVIDALKLNGINTIYGVPGIPITDLGRMAQAAGMRVISFRHEQHAGNAAAIAGFLTKKPGICLTVSAPGFLNGLTALANATTNCFPMILISGSSEREIVDLQQGDYEEMDQLAIAKPLCKAAFRVLHAARHRHRRGARDPRSCFRSSGRRLS
jgi:ribosomal protein S14